MNISISEHAYHKFLAAAQARGTTPEALVESLADQLPEGYAHDEDAFYRALGVDDARRQHIDKLANQLPDEPDW